MAMKKILVTALCGVLVACFAFTAVPSAYAANKAVAKIVKPAKVAIASVTSPSVSKVTVKVKKANRAKGYQYRLSTDKSSKKGVKTVNTTKQTANFTKLVAGKKYFVKVRAYAKSGKKTVYGAWSVVKAVTVKKKAANKSNTSSNTSVKTVATQVATVSVRGFGSFEITLYPEYAPKTVENFVMLANSGFYDGLTFHRMVAGFALQGGDPKGDGSGGSSANIIGEFSENGIANSLASQFQRGVVAMARSGSDYNSASSQFFVTLGTSSNTSTSLNNKYAAFGKVDATGMKVVDRIANACSAVVVGDNGNIPDHENQPIIDSVRVATVQRPLTAA